MALIQILDKNTYTTFWLATWELQRVN